MSMARAARDNPLDQPIPSDQRLIVALDGVTRQEAEVLVAELGDRVRFYKIGLEFVFAGGIELGRELRSQGKRVFFDMKLLDIGNTVEKAVRNAAKLGFDFITVHGLDRKTMAAAVAGRKGSDLKLLAVTVLTNLDKSDLTEQGIDLDSSALVARRSKMALDAGFDGVIASGHEARSIRDLTKAANPGFIIVTPGIRPAGGAHDDQKRVVTPAQAIKAGADYLVIGRPILKSPNRRQAALEIRSEIERALHDLHAGS